jgi:uncharacterized protein YraI
MKRWARTALATLLLATPMLALANEAQVTGNVNIYAGPDPGYPMVATLYAGTSVDVQGCTSGWEWCDVIVADNRGWVPGTYLQYYYENQPELVTDYGERIGIPIVAFSLGLYWDHYYRSRPFYHDRDRWYREPIPHRPPPRPFYGQGGRPDFDHRPDGNRGPGPGPDRGPRPDWNHNPNDGRGPGAVPPPQRPNPQQQPGFRPGEPYRGPGQDPRVPPNGAIRPPGNPGLPHPPAGDHPHPPPQGQHDDHGDHGDHKDDHDH